MKQLLSSILILLLGFSNLVHAQDTKLPLPKDKKVRKGVLPNGMTYYIQPTDVTKDAASYYIIQNVGSILENDDQQGLAHFLEHMAFNGTKHFEGKGILNTLQKHGAVFGKDINAYTSFDETVYNINNIPTTEALIDTCLLVLRDWADDLLLTDEEIEAERGVIQEEWRTRQSGQMRILKKQLPIMFNHTQYARRIPIGTMDVVMNFDPKVLRDFYHDWYRTDLQAIAIIGDVDVDVIEKKVKTLFSNILAVENPKKRPLVQIPSNESMQFGMNTDREVNTSSIVMGIRHPKKSATYETVSDLKYNLLNNMVTGLLSARLAEIAQKADAPFLGAYVSYGDLSRMDDGLFVQILPKPNQQQAALKSVMDEINRLKLHGFVEQELQREIVKKRNDYENRIKMKEDRQHGELAYQIQMDFLKGKVIGDVEKEYDFANEIMGHFTVEDLNTHFNTLITQENRYVLVTGVDGESNLAEIEAKRIIETSENDGTLEPYKEDFKGNSLVSDTDIESGSVLNETFNEKTGDTTYKLSNGVIVHYKYVDKNENRVQLKGISNGGFSLLKEEDLASGQFVNYVMGRFGLGTYSKIDLDKVLAGKSTSVNVSITDLHENIEGSSVTKDVETMLQMVYLYFVDPRFDRDAYGVFMSNVENYLIKRKGDINEKINDSSTVAIYGKSNPKKPIFNRNYIDQVSFEKIKSIYIERFKNPLDFEFFIVGDVQKDVIKPLLEKYIGGMPTSDTKEEWKDYEAEWLTNRIEKEVFLKMEDPKASVRIAYENEYQYTIRNQYLARALGDILTLRYTETLREEEGGTYGARTSAGLSKRPRQKAYINVSFDCNPQKAKGLTEIVHKEIQKVAKGEISQIDLDKTLANYLKEREQSKNKNQYTMDLLFNYHWEGYNMEDPKNFEDIIKNITVEDIALFAKKMLKGADSYQVIVKPQS